MESSATPQPEILWKIEQRIRTIPGEIFAKGVSVKTGEQVLLKVYGTGGHMKPGQASRFLDEVKKLSGVKSPHIATLKGGELSANGGVVAAFEIPQGKFLTDYLEEVDCREIPLRARMDFLLSLAEGISFLQGKIGPIGSIHPANIIVSGRHGRAIIVDPGLGRLSGLSVSGFATIVTPYIPLDVILNRTITISSDVFSFAALAYRFLTGERPFRGENVSALVASMMSSERIPLSSFLDGANQKIDNLIFRALVEDPAARPHDVMAFASDLETALIDAGLIEPKASAVDFKVTRDSGSTQSGIQNQLSKIDLSSLPVRAVIVILVVTLIGIIAVNTLVGSNNVEVATILDPQFQSATDLKQDTQLPLPAVARVEEVKVLEPNTVDLKTFAESNLPRLSERELASILSNSQTDLALGMKVVEESLKRGILLRPELFSSALRSPHYKVKIAALKAMEQEGQGATLSNIILTLATDQDPLVRGYAARTLGKVGNSSIIGGLQMWLDKEKDGQVQAVLTDSLKTIRKRLG